jgi:hypothetical protein
VEDIKDKKNLEVFFNRIDVILIKNHKIDAVKDCKVSQIYNKDNYQSIFYVIRPDKFYYNN